MYRLSLQRAALGLLSLLLLGAAAAQAQALLDQISLVPDAAVAANPVNTPQPFTITTAGSYTVTLTDLATPTPLSSMSVAITTANGPAQIFPLTTNGSATSAYSVTTTATFAAGSYFAQVLALANQPGGTFSVVVTPANGPSVLSYHDVIAAPSAPTVGSALQAQFTIKSQGSYTLTTTDFQFPTPLEMGSLTIFVTNDCSMSQSPSCNSVVVLSNAPGLSTATLAAGPYDLYAYAQADPIAGLYSMSITGDGTPATAYAASVPVGQLPAGYPFNIASAGTISFTLTDLATQVNLPQVQPLASLKAIVIEGSTQLASLSAATNGTPDTFAAASGMAQLYVAATPSSMTGQSAWAAYLTNSSGGTPADVAAPVLDSSHYGYDFQTPSLGAATYTLALHDFKLPVALAGQSSIVVQQATVLASIAAQNPVSVDLPFVVAQAGVTNLLVFPLLQTTTPNDDLFAIAVEPASAAPDPFQATQAVGTLFSAIPVNVNAAGNYGVTFTDLGFPAAFAGVTLIGTQGNTVIGQITPGGAGQGGTFNFTAGANFMTAGPYTLNVLAQVGTGQNYGLYGVTARPVPTVTLTPAATTVTSGEAVVLSWSSTNATTCTASGGWSGAEPISGSMVSLPAITQDTTYTLSCTGSGGPVLMPPSVTVNYSPPSTSSSSGGGGGGGAFSPGVLLALSLLAGLNMRRRRAMLPG